MSLAGETVGLDGTGGAAAGYSDRQANPRARLGRGRARADAAATVTASLSPRRRLGLLGVWGLTPGLLAKEAAFAFAFGWTFQKMAIEIKSCGGKRRGMSLLIGRSDLVISLPALAPSLAMLLPTSTRALLLGMQSLFLSFFFFFYKKTINTVLCSLWLFSVHATCSILPYAHIGQFFFFSP